MKNVKYYEFRNEEYKSLDNFNLIINFNKDNLLIQFQNINSTFLLIY